MNYKKCHPPLVGDEEKEKRTKLPSFHYITHTHFPISFIYIPFLMQNPDQGNKTLAARVCQVKSHSQEERLFRSEIKCEMKMS